MNASNNDDDDENCYEDEKDIRLGDVVVSLQSKDSAAVVQYNFGKSIDNGWLVRTGSLDKPPSVLRSGISKIQEQHKRKGHKPSQHVDQMFRDYPTLKGEFDYQGAENDCLFRANVIHVHERKSCKACCGDSGVNLVPRKNRKDTSPVIHYGTIGSADRVMKNPVLRDAWAKEENIICFEMEAAGIYSELPHLYFY
jgi:hypothetical protein